jgi:hypothetical protein
MGQTAETAESIGIIVWTVRPFLSYQMNDLKIQHCTFAFQYFLVFLVFGFYRRRSDLSFVEIRRNPAFEKRAHFRTCENQPVFQRLENPDLGSRFPSPWKTSPFSVSCFQGAPSQGRGAKKRSCHRRPQIEGYCLLVGSNERFEFCGNPPESSL